MSKTESSGQGTHEHKRKFTEGLLDNDRILDSLNIQAGQVIIDAGCGNGYMSKLFSKRVAGSGKVIALDPDAYVIDILKDECRNTNITALKADITQPTELEASSLDIIYLSTVFHGFSKDQIQGFVKEAGRLLKSGGTLAIVELEKRETPIGPPLNIRYSPAELKNAIPFPPGDTIQAGEFFYMQLFEYQQTSDQSPG